MSCVCAQAQVDYWAEMVLRTRELLVAVLGHDGVSHEWPNNLAAMLDWAESRHAEAVLVMERKAVS